MSYQNAVVGGYGEWLAARHTISAGMTLLDRNWRGRGGELDLILQDRDEFVFCEVKTRRSLRFGLPVEAVVPAKARRIRLLAGQWLSAARMPRRPARFDVISVLLPGPGRVRIEHRRDAF